MKTKLKRTVLSCCVVLGMGAISLNTYAGIFHHHHHNSSPNYQDQAKYSNLDEFTNKGDDKLDKAVKDDKAAIDTSNGKGGVKSSLADDWKAGYDFKCIDFKIVGVCNWLKITPFSVHYKSSPVVTHYSPDAIVEVFHNVSNEPTAYGKFTTKIARKIGNSVWSKAAFHGEKLENKDSRGRGFHEIQVMGNPLIMLHDKTIGSIYSAMGGYCDSGATPMYPYLHSLNDPEWRTGVMETAASAYGQVANFFSDNRFYVRDTSNGMVSTWGNLFPRTGVTENPSPFVGAAMAALRGGVLVTTTSAMGMSFGKGLEGSGLHVIPMKLKAESRNNVKSFTDQRVTLDRGKWKVLLPKTYHAAQCTTMPFAGVSTKFGIDEPETESRNYVFQMWRMYKCCKKKGQVYLGKIEWS